MVLPLWLTANLFIGATGSEYVGWVGLAMYLLSFGQSASHGLEDIPPPYNGTGRFVPRDQVSKATQTRMALLFPFLSFHEWIASPKLLPYQMLRGLHKLGYRKDLEKRVQDKAQRMLATGIYDPNNDWQTDPYHDQSAWAGHK